MQKVNNVPKGCSKAAVVGIIAALIQQLDFQATRTYWKALKNRLKKEESESVTKGTD